MLSAQATWLHPALLQTLQERERKRQDLLVAIQVPSSSAPCSSCPHEPFLMTSARSLHVNTRHSWPRQPWLGSHTVSALIPVFSECGSEVEGGVWAAAPSCCACCRSMTGVGSSIGSSRVGESDTSPGLPFLLHYSKNSKHSTPSRRAR